MNRIDRTRNEAMSIAEDLRDRLATVDQSVEFAVHERDGVFTLERQDTLSDPMMRSKIADIRFQPDDKPLPTHSEEMRQVEE